MRSETTKRILEETPQEVKDRVSEDVKFLIGRIGALSYKNREIFEKIMKDYIKELTEEYNIPYNEDEIEEYIKKDEEQTQHLLDNFGESSWHINDFANALRNEEISESFFRKLVRLEMDKCFKRINKMGNDE